MTKPRRIVAGEIHLITRRCLHRKFYIKPSPFVTAVLWFLLAKFATRYKLRIHAFVAMGNHHHILFTDPRGVYSEFIRDYHSELARVLNASRKRVGTFWERTPTHVADFADAGKVLAKMVYVPVNPIAAGLCAKAASYRGATTANYRIGQTLTFTDPGIYSGHHSNPETYSLTLYKPDCYQHLSNEAFNELLQEAVRKRELALRRERQRKGRMLMSEREQEAISIDDSPDTVEPFKAPVPTIIASTKESRRERKQVVRGFRARYKAARSTMVGQSGNIILRSVFPEGTWKLWRDGFAERYDADGNVWPAYRC